MIKPDTIMMAEQQVQQWQRAALAAPRPGQLVLATEEPRQRRFDSLRRHVNLRMRRSQPAAVTPTPTAS